MAKAIKNSVGLGGSNHPVDVMLVQYLLNCVPAQQGGPITELAVDGIVGPLTLQAIIRFQESQIGFSDGRIDVNGRTFQKLSAFDPYPQEPFDLVGVKEGKSAAGGPTLNGVKKSVSTDAGDAVYKSYDVKKTY